MSLSQARRIALAAQGLSRGRTHQQVSKRHLLSVFKSVSQLQIDSVNVVRRAHYMPIFARLGHYDTQELDRLVSQKHGPVTEYWAHEASYVRSELVPDLLSWQRRSWIDRSANFEPELQELSDRILDYLQAHPGTTARELSNALDIAPSSSREHWGWNWNDTKVVTESLFAQGKILSLGRGTQFERRFALAKDVLPQTSVHQEISKDESLERLIIQSLASQGIGTAHCVAEYFRLPIREVRSALDRLSVSGALENVEVLGLNEQCFMLSGTKIPRRVDADLRILAPFDSMVFNRKRLERFFDFEYRIEIYVPKEKRQYGYYVFPILYGEEFIGRIDLKADRLTGVLQVNAVHYENPVSDEIERRLQEELSRMAGWLELNAVKFSL